MRDIKRGESCRGVRSGYWRARNGEIPADEGDVANFKRDEKEKIDRIEGSIRESAKTHSGV